MKMDKSSTDFQDEIYLYAHFKSKIKSFNSKKRKNSSQINWLKVFIIIISILIITVFILLIYYMSKFPNISFLNAEKNKLPDIKQLGKLNIDTLKNFTLNIGNLKNLRLKITHLEYSYSLEYNISEVKYYFNFYDEFNNSIIPSKLLFYNGHAICHMKNEENDNIYDSFANIYEDKYFYCIEYFNIGEKLNFGVKVYTSSSYSYSYNYLNYGLFEVFFFNYNLFNFNDKNYKNDSKFNPLLINQEYSALENKIVSLNNSFEKLTNETLSLKNSYIMKPVCSPITSPTFLYDNWTFINIYNNYFCVCNSKDCYSRKKLASIQKYKYKFYISIIDNNRYVYNKTHYILGDFLHDGFSYDDAYPIFKEMLRRNMSVHYLTQRRDIFREYCKYNNLCQVIIKDIYMNGDFLEKYLELLLKLKVIIAGSDLLTMDYMFYNIEYITSINLGHGVKYFKSFLYKDYTSPVKYNKMLLVPSKKIINVALNYGWKEENIIKNCLPKWDKYDNYKKENKENDKSIFIFLTWRNLRRGKSISKDYFNNMLQLLNNETLIQKLIEKNITLYHRLHPNMNHNYYKIKINNPKMKFIKLTEISDTLMKSNLLITDFSSVTFDFVYQMKPIIIYIPDSEDPNIKDNYDDDYYNLVNSMKNGTIQFENKCNTTEQVINKIINYIDNNFELESNVKEFYDSFEFKCGNNTQSFINYIENLK